MHWGEGTILSSARIAAELRHCSQPRRMLNETRNVDTSSRENVRISRARRQTPDACASHTTPQAQRIGHITVNISPETNENASSTVVE